MEKILGAILFAVLAVSCGRTDEKDLSAKAKDEIIRTEKAFSKMSETEGMKNAFLFYAADDVVKLGNRQHPVVGKEELRKALEAGEDSASVLKWYPVKADAAASGDLGYTYGNWEYTGRDSTGSEIKAYGNYFTIWKKQEDGKWKFTLDGGNTTPQPEDNQERL